MDVVVLIPDETLKKPFKVGSWGVIQLKGLVPVLWQKVPLRYKGCKSVLFTKRFSDIKIKIISRIGKTLTELATGCLRTMKSWYICI